MEWAKQNWTSKEQKQLQKKLEEMAEENQVMTMKDWINETDNLLKFRKKEKYKNTFPLMLFYCLIIKL